MAMTHQHEWKELGLAPGRTVMIYEDPVTEKTPEGLALLLHCRNPNGGFAEGRITQYWEVRFTSDPIGEVSYRWILAPLPTHAGTPVMNLVAEASEVVDECVPIPDSDSVYVTKTAISGLRNALARIESTATPGATKPALGEIIRETKAGLLDALTAVNKMGESLQRGDATISKALLRELHGLGIEMSAREIDLPEATRMLAGILKAGSKEVEILTGEAFDSSEEEGEPTCPTCGTTDPAHPLVPGCRDCQDARQSLCEDAERRAGWDPSP